MVVLEEICTSNVLMNSSWLGMLLHSEHLTLSAAAALLLKCSMHEQDHAWGGEV